MASAEAPLRVYGLRVSYYTGKLEGYLRYKEIPYELVVATPREMARMRKRTGTSQVPAVELPDGRFMTDTTPMIDWLEARHPEPPVIPRDPLQGFASRLVEDYAEEWLWRPAMHYRWSYRPDRLHLSRKIVDEIAGDVPLPGFLKRELVRRRQRGFYVRGDGVTRATRAHVESIYLRTLDQLEAIFETRPYLLGELPTLSDLGFFASMFRHFAQDPTAGDLMRLRAPGVHAWQARLWNARASRLRGELLPGVPKDWSPILREIGNAYLPFLNANALAWKAGQKRFDAEIQGTRYRRMPVSQYRVWCLERLREHLEALPDAVREEARSLLEEHGCLEALYRVGSPDSRYDPEGRVPFRGRAVHYDNAGHSR